MGETPSEADGKSDALRAWYKANFESAGSARPTPATPAASEAGEATEASSPGGAAETGGAADLQTAAEVVDPDRLQALPAFDPTSLPAAGTAGGPGG
ncbi:MAG: hypothetical protein ACREJ2_05345, partial [Planctomycetota bacterium]